MDKVNQALALRPKGFNCSQVVFAVTSESIGLDPKTALRIATCFGGGIRMGETCGALTGALMALGLHKGHDIEDDLEEKQRVNQMTIDFVSQFRDRVGHVRCVDILDGLNSSIPEEKALIEASGLFEKKCPKAIEVAVKLLEEHL